MLKTNYKGSEATKKMVAEQIAARWGDGEVANYDAYKNCMPFSQWKKNGYQVMRGQKALKSITYVEVKDEAGEVVNTYPKTDNLFCIKQVEKITA